MPKKVDRRMKGEGSIRLRKDGKFEARYEAGYDNNGKRIRPTIVADTAKEVVQQLRKAQTAVENGEHVINSNITVDDWMENFLDTYKKKTVKASTFGNYQGYWLRFISPHIGSIKLKNLKNADCQTFINNLSDKNLSVPLIRNVYALLNSALEKAQFNQLINRVPSQNVEFSRYDGSKDGRAKYLTIEQQYAFLEASKNSKYNPFFRLALCTGMRVGEMLGLEWKKDVDFEKSIIRIHNTLTIVKSFERGSAIQTHETAGIHPYTKTKSSDRIIPMLDEARQALIDIKANQREMKKGVNDLYDPIYVGDDGIGNLTSPQRLNSAMRWYCEKAKIPRISMHTLRHTFATRGLEMGISLKVMQKLLGHAQLSMTANLYTHVSDDKMLDDILLLSGMFKVGTIEEQKPLQVKNEEKNHAIKRKAVGLVDYKRRHTT